MAEFQPQWDEKTLRQLIKRYDQNPSTYPEHFKTSLRQHAQYHNVPFYEGDFSIADAMSDFGAGFFEGFTTLHTGEAPDNEYEAIFRNLGHLAGFAPGIIGAPLGAAAKASAKLGLKSQSLLTAASMARQLNDKSIPMAAAKIATDFAKKSAKPFLRQGQMAKTGAVSTASNFLMGERARHIAEGAFHLGAASAVSAWQGGVDEMMSAFIGGAQAGGIFRSIGNFINVGNEAGNKVAKSLAGSLFMGLPATARGATTPEQVYEYVMGAWFGGQERPWTIAKAGKFQKKYEKDAKDNKELEIIKDPELHPEFKDLPPEVQPVAKEMFANAYGTPEAQTSKYAAQYFARKGKIDIDKILTEAEKPLEPITDPTGQEPIQKLEPLKKVPTGEVKKREKEEFEAGSLGEDNVGVAPTLDPKVGNLSSNIVKYNMPDIFKELKLSPAENRIKREEVGNKLGSIIENYLKKNTGVATNESVEAVTKIQEMLAKDYNYQIKSSKNDPERVERFEGEIRQFLGRYNNDTVTNVLTTNGTDLYTLSEKSPKNLAGNKKIVREPLKPVDILWQKLTNRNEKAHTFLDHIVVKGASGNKEITLQKLKQSEYAEYGGEKDYYKLVKDTMVKMDKQGSYYWGGKGTNDRLYFFKYHPKTKSIKMGDFKGLFKKSDIDALRKDYIRKYGLSGDYFDKAFKSNVLWGLELNGLEYSRANIKKMLSEGFLSNAIAFNKRLPLLMTNSYAAEKEFFQQYKDADTGLGLGLTKDGNFKYTITPDFHQNMSKEFQAKMKEAAKYADIKSSQTEERLDGAIIARDDVVRAMNLEKGTPESRTNKSLIWSPHPELGALAGKYAIHPAGEKLSAEMRDAGLHFDMMSTAVKQKGGREFYGEYELDPTHIYQDYGIKQSKKFIAPQTIKKQMLTNLVESISFMGKTKDNVRMSEVVEDIYKTLIEPRVIGQKEANEAFELYKEKLTTASDKELARELDKLDFDNIGIEPLTEALKIKGNQLFAKKFYNHLLLKRKESLKDEFEAGEISESEYESNNREVEEYHSVAQKMIAASRRDAISRGKPENEVSIFVNPDIKNYRDKMLSSYIRNQVTKPKIENAAAAIIRPYDDYLMKDADNKNPRLKELNTNSKLFFLGDMHKKKVLDTDLYGKKTLEELYKIYLNKNTPDNVKKELKEVFRTAVIRVPADSNSGTQILEFAGFTGRNDYGVLIHGLKMRALGGADLDIDSAYLYFGGRGGFKKSWKDVMESQEQEFYEKQKDGRFKIADNKAKEFEDRLIESYSPKADALFKSQAGMFAPNMRHQASEGAVEGRGLLGGAAVNPKNILASAYETILRKGEDTFKVKYFNKDIEVTLIPRTKPEEKAYANKLMRAMVGFSSDAMDYGKPKGYENWYKQALQAHFIIKSKTPNVLDKVGISAFVNNGIIGALNNANKAYYGKDYSNNRQWSMEDRKYLTKDLMNEQSENITTITPKIARLLYNVDYSDNALNRINQSKLKDLFDTYNNNVKQYSGLKDPMGRRSMGVLGGTYINKTFKHKLLNPDEVIAIAKNEGKYEGVFENIIKGTRFEINKKTKQKREYKTVDERINVLNRLKETASDFAIRDIQTLVTVQEVSKIVNAIKNRYPQLTDFQINNMISNTHKTVEGLKSKSYLMRDDRNTETLYDNKKKQTKSTGSAENDQNAIDAEIRKWKRNKTDLEKRLFDTMMLGSLNRGEPKRLAELNAIKAKRKLTFKEQEEYDTQLENTARTSSSMLGYNSEAMQRGSLDKFLGEINNIYNEVSEQRAPKQIRKEGTIIAEEPTKKENIEKGWPEHSDKKLVENFVNTTGWEGVKEAKEVKLDNETKGYINDILLDLKTENNKVAQNIGFLAREVVGKDINIFNKQDWMLLRNWFRDVKTGTLWQRLKGEGITKLSQRAYLQFPETVNRELMKDEIVLMQQEGIFLTEKGMKLGKITKPTQYLDILQSRITKANEAADGLNDDLAFKIAKEYSYLDGMKDGQKLWEVAMVTRELPMADRLISKAEKKDLKLAAFHAKTYKDAYNLITKQHNYEADLKNKIYNITLDGKPTKISGKDIVDRINASETKYYKEKLKLARGNVPVDKNGDLIVIGKDKNGNDLYPLQDAIVKGIPGMTSGPKNSGYVTGYYDPLTKQNPKINISKLTNDVNKWLAKGNKFPEEFGIDGVNTIARSMMYEMASKNKNMTPKEKQTMFFTFPSRTGRIKEDMYFPHAHFNKKTALDALKKYAEYLRKSDLPLEEQTKLINKLAYRHHALTGDYMFEEINQWDGFYKGMDAISKRKSKKEERIDWVKNIRKAGSQMSREGHLPGYSFDRQVPIGYGKSLNNTYFRQWAQIFSRDTINKFEKSMFDRKVPKEISESWSNFAKLYVQGAIGNPDVVPEYIYENPNMKIKGTPYGWWADNRVKNRLNKIGDKLGLIKKDLPENLRGLDLNDVKKWSNVEAKFELASLLAHPKSAVANIFGGTMHTIQSVGFSTWKNARNDKFMSTINPDFASKSGRDAMAVKHGIYPEQLMEEYGLNREFQSVKNTEFISDIARKMRRDPNLSSESVIDLAKKRQITKPVMELAAKFMSIPERALRRDAFMAHYLHWWNKFNGAIKDFDHPILIELAKKGVKSTQFLYSAPYRPMFARTALGKVMTRFQLWGWNAVRFRKDALKQARLYGFKGSEAQRAARMMQLDLFVFAMGNAFAYSLFDTAMPAPYNWFQDTSEWLFGDEKERNRAFFGQWPRAVAPLQLVTPPILRLPMSSMRAILEDDWEKVSNYYIHTMYPFGRISRDFVGKNNLIENPMSLVDKWTGVPLLGLSKASKDLRKDKERRVETPGPDYF